MTDVAEQFAEALLAPLRDVGEMLAKELDDTNARIRVLIDEIAALRHDVASMGRVVASRTDHLA